MDRTTDKYIQSGENRLHGTGRTLQLLEVYHLCHKSDQWALSIAAAFHAGVETGYRQAQADRRAKA